MKIFQPTMFVFAGNNGSGKSTIRNLIVEKIGIEINIDNLIKSIDLLDHIQIIDNTFIDAEIILVYRNNHFIYKSKCIPKWAIPIESTLNNKKLMH